MRLELTETPEAFCYAKVVEGSDADGSLTIRLTSRSPAVEAALAGRGSNGEKP